MELHAVVVHFAIGLVLVSVLFDILGVMLKKDSLKDAGLWTMVFGSAGVIVAVITGIAEAKELSSEGAIPPEAIAYLKTHRNIGLLLMFLIPLLAGLRIFVYVKKQEFLHYVYVGISIIFALVIIYQGNLGGKLVYKFGLGTSITKIYK
jgi:uncharacterized membrane protein